MIYRILAINPGSTSTKIAVYDNEKQILVKSIDHKVEDLEKYVGIKRQLNANLRAFFFSQFTHFFSVEYAEGVGNLLH